jgi:lipopolysaccharide/colanic/teichoic acid biosynthesis glycosyltransferase
LELFSLHCIKFEGPPNNNTIREFIVKFGRTLISNWLAGKYFSSQYDNTIFLSQKLFNHFLCLERKRSQRTGHPFVLLIVDFSPLLEEEKMKTLGACTALRAETRDTDLCGWYRADSLFGVIFTALPAMDRKSAETAISAKVERALDSVLDADQISRIRVSFHYFPENSESEVAPLKADERLYPDLMQSKFSRTMRRIVKRGMDVSGSALLLALLSPLLALIFLSVKLSSKGPALFRQERVGRLGARFSCLKFRTMYVNCDHEIHRQYVQKLIQQGGERQGVYKIVNDPRVTPVGKFLRKSSLDELPQLFNVLCGQMSLVGPRPPIPYEISCYRSWHWRRIHESKPGITGMWQVFGRSRTNFDEMVRLDIRYIEDHSIWLDVKLLLLTPWVVITGSGAY